MTIKSGLRNLSWTIGGTIALILVMLMALHYHRQEGLATRAAFKAGRIVLVEKMGAALSSASEAEMSAVMATTDQESQVFAQEARAQAAAVEQMRDELGRSLADEGTRDECELLAEFSLALTEYLRIDRELLDLAVRNTNLKAYGLAFGSAADALAGMDGALSRILKQSAASASPEALQILMLAAGAQSGALRIHSLLPPHISEESDQRMNELEAKMATEDRNVRSNLKGLEELLPPESPDLKIAVSDYARYAELKAQVIELSRENTNVRSLMISLNQKKKATRMCQDALASLKQTIEEDARTDRLAVSPR